ncbi:MAG: UDP-N-acetylmuramoyl-L-alanine--D-glutamate ligase [Planctomycetota bacterium]|nr:UDP-N-acetylmuramoyl-L-alanine--D-glutamate ligase [Planctomycetota bacterium]
MGLGLFGGGLGVTRYLYEQGAKVHVTDLKDEKTLRPSLEKLSGLDITYRLGSHEEKDFTDCDILLVNPAVPPSSPYIGAARRAGVELETELNLFMKLCWSPVTGITGANGKSTTTALTHWIVKQSGVNAMLGGNIGRSLLDIVDQTGPDVPVILELSSFQLENLRWLGRSPSTSVVTNITPNHLDRHGTMSAYTEAKAAILDYQGGQDVAILNADDEVASSLESRVKGKLWKFSLADEPEQGAFVDDGQFVLRLDGTMELICATSEMNLAGSHNIENALAAILASRSALGDRWNRDRCAEALATFECLEHRLERVRTHKGVTYYNDSIATNPESVIVALKSMAAPKILIAGGYDKKLSFNQLAESVCTENVSAVILIGQTSDVLSESLEKAFDKHGTRVDVYKEKSLADAVERAGSIARWGELVLLSPGCASYGMFTNFEERGKLFKEYVGRLT